MTRRLWYINLLSMFLILVFGTLLADRYMLNIDLTEKKLYTLSQATERILNTMKNRVTVKVFFSRDIPYPYNTAARYVLDLLRDYRRLSGGRLSVDRVDPDSSNFESEAARYGIPPVQVNAIENDQIQIKKVYMGLAFVSGDKIETIPVVTDPSNLEYEISSTLRTIQLEGKKTIGLVTGHGEPRLNTLRELLRRQYHLKNVNTKDGDMKDIDLLLVVGPRQKFTKDELLKIDQFIMRGGKVLFLIDRVDADLQYGFGREINTGVEELLDRYGLKIEPALVYDLSSGMVNVSERRGGFLFTTVVRYPFFPKVVNLNREMIITRDIETLTFGYTSPIGFDSGNRNVTILARTTNRSGVLRSPFYVGVGRSFNASDFSGPASPVAVILAGDINSAYPEEADLKEGRSRLIVVSDSEFVTDEFIQAPGNAQFILNCIDWLLEDDSLITIRSKRFSGHPIKVVPAGLQKAIKYSIILIPPIITVLVGVVVWSFGKRRRINL